MSATLNTYVTPSQRRFLTTPTRLSAFVGGVGSGKTRSSVLKALAQPPGSVGMMIAPTYPMLKDALLRTFVELARPMITEFNKSDYHVKLMNGSEVLFRSADNPDRLRGPNLGWFALDEAAMMTREALDIMLGRLRLAPGNAWLTTTPRGRNHWLYDFVTAEGEGVKVVRAGTADNPFLPKDFIGMLERQYTGDFLRQELLGEFIEMGGAVFADAHYYDELPLGGYREAWGADWAYTASSRADYSVALQGRVYGGTLYLTDMARQQTEVPAFVATLKARGVQAVTSYMSGTEKAIEQFLAREGINVNRLNATGDKFARAQPFAAAWNTGKILLPRNAPWLQPLLSEVLGFTGVQDKHDDIVDAGAALVAELMLTPEPIRRPPSGPSRIQETAR